MDSNFKKLNFCNFSAHFSPIALPTRTPSFSPQGASFGHEFPSTPLSVRPIISPFRGNLWGSFEVECCASLSKSDAFGVIFDQSERETGEISGRMDGENFRDFYSEGSPERAWNGMAAVGKMGTKKGRSNELLQSFRVSLFVRHYVRLISDGIVALTKIHCICTIAHPRQVCQGESAKFGKISL